jgi:hypothetical protein
VCVRVRVKVMVMVMVMVMVRVRVTDRLFIASAADKSVLLASPLPDFANSARAASYAPAISAPIKVPTNSGSACTDGRGGASSSSPWYCRERHNNVKGVTCQQPNGGVLIGKKERNVPVEIIVHALYHHLREKSKQLQLLTSAK